LTTMFSKDWGFHCKRSARCERPALKKSYRKAERRAANKAIRSFMGGDEDVDLNVQVKCDAWDVF